ncbi:hypothetical protein SAMN04487843_105125 [Methylobacterium sp. ap11]|nr:hypothetical protein SAMN04487843_105125 [Methylobacterium sp. ap11]
MAAPEMFHPFKIDPKHGAGPTGIGASGMCEQSAFDPYARDLALAAGRFAVAVEKAARYGRALRAGIVAE